MTTLTCDPDHAVGGGVAWALAGEVPTSDDRFRAVGDDRADDLRARADAASDELEGQPAERILAWAAGVIPRFAVTSSFGADSAVLLHLLSRVAPDVPVLFLETGLHFVETVTFRRELAADLGLSVVDLRPERSVAQQAADEGDELWARDPARCCELRKTRPLRQALSLFDGWATGVRRSQTLERGSTPIVEARRHDGRWAVKVAPLAGWTEGDVERYLVDHALPRHPLVAEGYRSIGCAPCTAPTSGSDDPRAGRWAAFADREECGIHLTEDGTVIRTAAAAAMTSSTLD